MAPQDRPRFVVHKHTRPGDTHWDFMLEHQGTLLTWRLPLPPARTCKEACQAIRIFDHPLRFLTYEGPVNKGTGNVEIVDKGHYQLLSSTLGMIDVELAGKHFKGPYQLKLQQDNHWQLSPDQPPTS